MFVLSCGVVPSSLLVWMTKSGNPETYWSVRHSDLTCQSKNECIDWDFMPSIIFLFLLPVCMYLGNFQLNISLQRSEEQIKKAQDRFSPDVHLYLRRFLSNRASCCRCSLVTNVISLSGNIHGYKLSWFGEHEKKNKKKLRA